MSIREKRTSISQFAAALRQRSSQDKRDLLVADTLDSLCRHCDLVAARTVHAGGRHEKSPPERAFFTGLQPFRYRTRPIR